MKQDILLHSTVIWVLLWRKKRLGVGGKLPPKYCLVLWNF